MYESITTVGERGQITLPKIIRENEGIKSKDKLVVKIESNKIVVEKIMTKKEQKQLMLEGYKKMAKKNIEIEKDMKYTSKEADKILDDY